MADKAPVTKGWYIKQSFSNDFTHLLEELYKKYGEDVFAIQGIANKHMDIAQFSRNFFGKSSNVADLSVDGNANVREKNITQYNYENNKALMKLNSLYLLFKYVRDMFDLDSASAAIEKIVNGELFVNDFTNVSMPYCFSFDLRELLDSGMAFFDSSFVIHPPKRSESFVALVIQTTAYVSNQIMGAASYPDFFPILDKFYRTEHGEDYIEQIAKTPLASRGMIKKIKNQFQNLIYSFNFPFRGNQSPFVNLSVMDRGFIESLFGGYTFPDGTSPNYDSTIALSKMFFEYYTEINGAEGIFTFPIMTIAISLDNKGNYIDPDFVDWAAGANCGKSLANIFQSAATSFSSCCRMKNDFSKVADAGYQNSFGVGGLSIGSHRVAGLNMPRMALLERDNPEIIQEDLDILHKILYAHRQLIRDRIDGGFLPLYTTHWISLRRQYSTIGFVGSYEYLRNHGLSITTSEGLDKLTSVLKLIETNITKWQQAEAAEGNIYNIEQIPAESMAVRLAQIDTALGYNPQGWELYSNQYIPLIEDASIYDRFCIQGKIDQLTSGGAILHINIDDAEPLDAAQFRRMMEMARRTGTVYFAVNYAYSECAAGHVTVGKRDTCPICGQPIAKQYTRVVGFITPVAAWNKVRRDYEYDRRVFYKRDVVEPCA